MATGRQKDDWKLCAEWLVRCQILAEGHKVTFESAQVFDLAQVLRDGVLICHLLNRLYPNAIDSKDFSQRPQMSQFLCLKNIRVFLQASKHVFNLEDKDLFESYDLFEVKDFGKVIKTLSKISNCTIAQRAGIQGFRAGKEDDDIYAPLSDIAVDFPPPEDKNYDIPIDDEDEDAEKIYDDLTRIMSSIQQKETQQHTTKRDYCLKEILETEKNYTDALDMVCKFFIQPLQNIIPQASHDIIFFAIKELYEHHTGFHDDLQRAQSTSSSSSRITIPDCFIQWKEKFLIYGEFCSNLPKAQELVDELRQKNTVIDQSINDCQQKANQGRFRLRDLLSVPMQRVLKYHLLIKELLKNTPEEHPEHRSLQRALEEMQDLSLYVNEVKRDNEQLQLVQEIQNSIIDLQMPPDIQLKDYGRIQLDGELKVKNHEDTGRNKTRYVFVFDKVMLLCKSRGDSYNFRDALVLSQFKVEKIENAPKNMRPEKGWQFPFLLVKKAAKDDSSTPVGVWTIYCKTEDMRRKWMDAIEMAQENTSPNHAREGNKDFIMHTFKDPTICDVCKKLLRGVFYQGYKCTRTGTSVHKECVQKAKEVEGPPSLPARQASRRESSIDGPVIPPRRTTVPSLSSVRCKATHHYPGIPRPSDGRSILIFNIDDVIDLISDNDDFWWEGRLNGQTGFFPSRYVQKIESPRRPSSVFLTSPHSPPVTAPGFPLPHQTSFNGNDVDLSQYPWFVGHMARDTAIKRLESHKSGTFMIRERTAHSGDYAMSIKYVGTSKHIRVQKSPDNCFFLADSNMFRAIQDLVSHYQKYTLGNSFPELPTMLITPFKDAERQLHAGPVAVAIGRCTAIYAFSANQSNQLSLQVGDQVEVLSKAGGDRGWWKGRRGEKSGYFPSAYVVEDPDDTA